MQNLVSVNILGSLCCKRTQSFSISVFLTSKLIFFNLGLLMKIYHLCLNNVKKNKEESIEEATKAQGLKAICKALVKLITPTEKSEKDMDPLRCELLNMYNIAKRIEDVRDLCVYYPR